VNTVQVTASSDVSKQNFARLLARFVWFTALHRAAETPSFEGRYPSFVAAETVLFAMLRALAATLIMLPIGYAILGHIPWVWRSTRGRRSPGCAGSRSSPRATR
jgi:hypothetical protein